MDNMIRMATSRIKQLCGLREPPFELPSDSFIDKAAEDIIRDIFNSWQWIDANECMPKYDGRYLVVENHSYRWIGISTMRHGSFDMKISHWMPLPNPPKENLSNG